MENIDNMITRELAVSTKLFYFAVAFTDTKLFTLFPRFFGFVKYGVYANVFLLQYSVALVFCRAKNIDKFSEQLSIPNKKTK